MNEKTYHISSHEVTTPQNFLRQASLKYNIPRYNNLRSTCADRLDFLLSRAVTKTDLLFAVVDDEEPVRTALQRHQLCSTSNRQNTAKHSQTAGTNAAALLMISIHCRDSHPLPLGKNQTFNRGSIPIDETVCSSIIFVGNESESTGPCTRFSRTPLRRLRRSE